MNLLDPDQYDEQAVYEIQVYEDSIAAVNLKKRLLYRGQAAEAASIILHSQ